MTGHGRITASKREKGNLKTFSGHLPEKQGHDLAVTVYCVPYSGLDCLICAQNLALTVQYVPASQRRALPVASTARDAVGQNSERLQDFYLKAKARIWP